MAIPLLIATIVIAAAASAYAIYAGRNAQKPSNTGPQGIESFDITQAKEGSTVPLIYGTVRINSNIIYYGNLQTEGIVEKTKGGKGGGGKSSSQVVGYNYYLDVWHVLCEGKVSIEDTYLNDENSAVTTGTTLFNDSTTDVKPTGITYGTRLRGISHIYYGSFLAGENTTVLPTVHFVLKRDLNTPVNHQNMTSGTNPAAILYDLVNRNHDPLRGTPAVEINLASFNTAAAYWNTQGYGLNMTFTQQEPLYEAQNKVFSQVDGVMYEDVDGKIAISAFDPDAAVFVVINDDDISGMSLQRPALNQLPNVFTATIRDKDQDYTERVVGPIINAANIAMIGKRIPENVDLSGFNDMEIASKRLFEVVMRQSYPAISLEFTTDMRFFDVMPGHLIEINCENPPMSGLVARVIEVDHGAIDSLEIKIKASQVVERIVDKNFIEIGGSLNVPINRSPSTAPSSSRFLSLVGNPVTIFNDVWYYLIARGKSTDTYVRLSTRNSQIAPAPAYPDTFVPQVAHYTAPFEVVETFSELVALKYEITSTFTKQSPSGVDITFTSTKQLNLTGTYGPLNRREMFATNRFLVIQWVYQDPGTLFLYGHPEFIIFEEIEHTGTISGTYHYAIKNPVRWAFWSERYKNTFINLDLELNQSAFLATIGDNITPIPPTPFGVWARSGNVWGEAGNSTGSFCYPYPNKNMWDFDYLANASFYSEVRVVIERTGTDVEVKFYIGAFTSSKGAGKGNESEVTDDEHGFAGNLVLSIDSDTKIISSPNNNALFSGVSGTGKVLAFDLSNTVTNAQGRDILFQPQRVMSAAGLESDDGTMSITDGDGTVIYYVTQN